MFRSALCLAAVAFAQLPGKDFGGLAAAPNPATDILAPAASEATATNDACYQCVKFDGGEACLGRCNTCGSACTSCVAGAGGMACADRCTSCGGSALATEGVEILEGFVQGYAAATVKCGGELGTFESSVQSVVNGLSSMMGCWSGSGSGSTCTTTMVQSGWNTVASGLQGIVSGTEKCATESWWGSVKNWANKVITTLVPEVKVVEDMYQIVVNGENIVNDLKSSWAACTGDRYYTCGEDLGGLAAKLKSDIGDISDATTPDDTISTEDMSSATSVKDMAALQALIAQHEGDRKCVYTDTTGHPTVGIGYNLDDSGASALLASVGANYASVRAGTQCLTSTQVSEIFQATIGTAITGAKSDVTCFDSLCAPLQNVMVDLTFNMGSGSSGFGGFGSFIADVCAGSWAAAGSNLRGTLWCTQVGQRCTASAADGGDVAIVEQGCSGSPGPAPAPTPATNDACFECVKYNGGEACLGRCTTCGSACTSCVSNAGGMACADRCTSCGSSDAIVQTNNGEGHDGSADASDVGASTGLIAGIVCAGALVVGLAMLVEVRRRAWARLTSPRSTPTAMADLDGASHSRSIAKLQHPGGAVSSPIP